MKTFLLGSLFCPQKIPRYIITLHELLAHTPHEHVERKSLEFAKSKLEELSRYGSKHSDFLISTHRKPEIKCDMRVFFRVMHDEVSDTENIRKNLAIERMIVEGCDILLDTSQTFVRQGEPSSSRTIYIFYFSQNQLFKK